MARGHPPVAAELRAHLVANAERFTLPERLAFVHVFVRADREARGQATLHASALRAELEAGTDPARLGDPFPHGSRQTRLTLREVGATFGVDFAERIAVLRANAWSQPIASSFGVHLVRVDERLPASLPDLAEIRAEVAADWRREQRRAAERRAVARLRERYDVVGAEPSAPVLPADR